MGTAVAQRLLAHGYEVRGWDIQAAQVVRFEQLGGRAASHSAELFDRCPVILLSLPDSRIVSELLMQHKGTWAEGQQIIDMTTGDPRQMCELAELLRQRNATYIEASVAGSSEQLRAGEASIFLGCEAELSPAARHMLESLTKQLMKIGNVGSASRFKLVHNLVLGLHRAALAEGLVFAEALGFDPKVTLELLKRTPAFSQVMLTKGEKMVEGDYRPQARLAQHHKDVRLMLTEAKRHSLSLPMTTIHDSLLSQAEALGFGELDNSAIIEALRAGLGLE
jgi:3-hydroxyisobutyrate dehydrogenase-like beta-hydroxyacid dehydrogenase